MQEPQNLVRICHISDPGIPSSVCESIPETGQGEDNNKDGVWWVYSDDNVGDKMAQGRDDGDPLLPVLEVDSVVKEGGGCVTDQRGEEDE